MTSVQSFDESLQAAPGKNLPAETADGSPGLMAIYSLTIFLSAFLLFQVQPLIGKFILPWFGGMPSVWTTCMLFFQLLLFGGYAYAHFTTSHLRPRWQAIVHVVLLAAACIVLPIIPGDTFKPTSGEAPISRIILVLGATVGVPFFILSSTGPLLQGWFSRTHQSRSPYRLYALSNVGSLLALITFPMFFEWLLPTRFLAWMWSISFIVFALLCAVCAWAAAVHGRPLPEVAPEATASEARPGWGTWLLWFALAMVPSVLLLATTNQVCLDVATVPFLWVLPLTLYLLSFILCFDSDRWYSRRYFIPGAFVAMACVWYALDQAASASFWMQLGAYFTGLFMCAMVCHGELVRRKPHVRYLTSFYLVISAGGAAGGIFVGIVAPYTFTGYYELHIGLYACALLILIVLGLDRRQMTLPKPLQAVVWLLLVGFVSLLGVELARNATERRDHLLSISRNFYGVLRVREDDEQYSTDDDDTHREPTHELLNGRIEHGFQYLDPKLRRIATSYYGVTSGVGRVLSVPSDGSRHVGLVGLGTGTLAVYAHKGDHFQFYEINSEVEKLARKYFTYLDDCRGEVEIIHGDARLNLAREQPQGFNLLVLDAFSGDAIPVHLLTKEAFAIYLPHMAPDGIIAVHISNKHFDLEPVVLAIADVYDLSTVTIDAQTSTTGDSSSSWVLVSASPRVLRAKRIYNARRKNQTEARVLWTDDHASLFELLMARFDNWFARAEKRAKPHPGGVDLPTGPKKRPAERP